MLDDGDENIEPLEDSVAEITQPEPDPKPRSKALEPKAKAAAEEYDGGKDISKLLKEPEAEKVVEAPAPVTTADNAKKVARAWKAYREGKELSDEQFATLTAAQLLESEFEYNANGKPHRKKIDDLFRTAQWGHHNQQKTVTLEQEREHAVREWQQAKSRVDAYEADRKAWSKALTAATRGNFQPIQDILTEFQKAMDADEPAAPAVPEGYISPEMQAAQAAGQKAFDYWVVPAAQKLADQYHFPIAHVQEAAMALINREPAEFMTEEKLRNILEVELPYYVEQVRLQNPEPEPEPDPRDAKLAALEAKIAKLSEKEVDGKNAVVVAAHQRRKAAPPGVPSTNSGSGGTEEANEKDFESVSSTRNWLRNLK